MFLQPSFSQEVAQRDSQHSPRQFVLCVPPPARVHSVPENSTPRTKQYCAENK
jgi:hypothetical protein